MLRLAVLIAALCGWVGSAAADVALAISVQGRITRLGDEPARPLETLARLRDGDRLALEAGSRLRLVYFESGRQETWTGPGRLEVAPREGRPDGLAAADTRTLPLATARQIARTPDTADPRPTVRTRAVPTPDALGRLDEAYRNLRAGRTDPDDLGPEIYLLSGLFELRELDRVERVMADLQQERRGNPEAGLLVALYRKAVRNAREARK